MQNNLENVSFFFKEVWLAIDHSISSVQFNSVQSLSCVWLFATPWIAAHQASLSITNSRSSLKLTSIESVMPSNHLILCRPLLLLPPIPPIIRVDHSINEPISSSKIYTSQYSCLENPMDGGAWGTAVHWVAKSWTRPSDFTFTFHFHALEKEMATHPSILAWRIPGTEEPSGLPSMGLHRVRHDWSDLAAASAAEYSESLTSSTVSQERISLSKTQQTVSVEFIPFLG